MVRGQCMASELQEHEHESLLVGPRDSSGGSRACSSPGWVRGGPVVLVPGMMQQGRCRNHR